MQGIRTLFDAVWDEDGVHFSVPPECNLRYTRQLVPFAVYIDGSKTNEHWRGENHAGVRLNDSFCDSKNNVHLRYEFIHFNWCHTIGNLCF